MVLADGTTLGWIRLVLPVPPAPPPLCCLSGRGIPPPLVPPVPLVPPCRRALSASRWRSPCRPCRCPPPREPVPEPVPPPPSVPVPEPPLFPPVCDCGPRPEPEPPAPSISPRTKERAAAGVWGVLHAGCCDATSARRGFPLSRSAGAWSLSRWPCPALLPDEVALATAPPPDPSELACCRCRWG